MPVRFGKSSLFCRLLFSLFLEYKKVCFLCMAEKDTESVGMEVRQLYEKGYGMLEKKQYEYAVELLAMAIEKEPAFFDCRVALRAAQINVSKGKGKIGRMAAAAAAAGSPLAAFPAFPGLWSHSARAAPTPESRPHRPRCC